MMTTINQIKARARAEGSHWFDPSTMRCFGSRVSSKVYDGPGGCYFVSSEQPPHGPREFSVRSFCKDTADIGTVGDFCSMSRGTAHAEAERQAAGNGHATIITEDFRPVTETEQLKHTVEAHGGTERAESWYGDLLALAHRYDRYVVDLENGAIQHDEEGELPANVTACGDKMREIAEYLGCKGVKLGGDPRGCTVKLLMADGYTDDFGEEGVCVPLGR
jgi:hypothetical protein